MWIFPTISAPTLSSYSVPVVLYLCCTLAVPAEPLKFPRPRLQPRQNYIRISGDEFQTHLSGGDFNGQLRWRTTAWTSNSIWWNPNLQQYLHLSLEHLTCAPHHLVGVSTCRSHGNNSARTLNPASPITHHGSSPGVHSSASAPSPKTETLGTPLLLPPLSTVDYVLLFSHTSRSPMKSAMESWFLLYNLWAFVWIFK